MARGRFIVLEGIDGCGSTSQAERLVEALRERGLDARFTCEPTDGPIGALIRGILEHRVRSTDGGPHRFGWPALGLLFAADRHDHVDSVIESALAAGAVVVSDRYALSTVAYQCALAAGDETAAGWLREINGLVTTPDLTIVIDVTAELAEQRRAARGSPEELFEKRDLQRRLADLDGRAEQLVPLHRIVHVDGSGTLDQVATQIRAAAERVLPAG